MEGKTPVIRRQIVSEVSNGNFSTIALMHMAHYDVSAALYVEEAKRLQRPIDVANIGAGDLWDLTVLIHGMKIKKSAVLRSYHAMDIVERESPFGKLLSENITYTCTAKDMMVDPTFPMKDRSKDVVVCTEFIEHIDKDSAIRVLEEIYRVLRKDGLLYITTPNADNTSRTDKYHIYEWPLNELKTTLKGIGFRCGYYGTYIDQKTFEKANREHQRIPQNVVDAVKDRFTSNFHRLFLATLYPEYSNGVAIYAEK